MKNFWNIQTFCICKKNVWQSFAHARTDSYACHLKHSHLVKTIWRHKNTHTRMWLHCARLLCPCLRISSWVKNIRKFTSTAPQCRDSDIFGMQQQNREFLDLRGFDLYLPVTAQFRPKQCMVSASAWLMCLCLFVFCTHHRFWTLYIHKMSYDCMPGVQLHSWSAGYNAHSNDARPGWKVHVG